MKIEAVSLSLPSWQVSNEELIDLIKFHSKATFSGNLDKTLRKISTVLNKTGAKNRFWLNRQINEKPIDHIKKSTEEALKKANLQTQDIDLLIFVGIGKGFLEPAQSYFVAQALGMVHAKCFDITDACMSWLTAMQVADSLFKSGAYKNAMIINAEFCVQAGVFFKNYALKNEQQLTYTFPTFTIGEAATCTILSPNNPSNFQFNFSSRNDLASLCTVPLPEFKDYCQDNQKTGANGDMHFSSFGVKLHQIGQSELLKLLKISRIKIDKIDIAFTHSSSKTEWQKVSDKAGIGDKVYHIYQQTGNLISASVPAAMAMAMAEQKFTLGNQALLWVGSAGMSFGTCYFIL